MTPNVSHLLIKWGVADVVGRNLVEVEELNMRRLDGTKVGYTKITPNMRKDLGFPFVSPPLALSYPNRFTDVEVCRWWVVHRAHLHAGLVEIAQKLGATLLTNSRVNSVDYSSKVVKVRTESGREHTFDLLVGSDGVNSIVRKTLFPTVKPAPPTPNCAYRAIVPYAQIRKDPISRELIEKPSMEVWMSPNSYIITYPISDCKDLNLVLSHHVANNRLVSGVEDVEMEELRETYKDYDPRIKRIVDMIPTAQRWPLLVTGPLESWSSEKKNVVLMGDAAHSMTNHMAQGAATAIEDGAFLGRCIQQVLRSNISLEKAIEIYEKARMPKARMKQQMSFLNGAIWQLPEGTAQVARDNAMKWELQGKDGRGWRSPNLYGDPRTVWEVYGYDAEAHADECLADAMGIELQSVTADRHLNWYLPEGEEGRRIAERIQANL